MIVRISLIVLAGVMWTSLAQSQDSLKQCHQANSVCQGDEWEVFTDQTPVGGLGLVYIDYDIHDPAVDFCDLVFYATYDSTALQYLGGLIMSNDTAETIDCAILPEPPSEFCSTCDSLLWCWWGKLGGDQRPYVSVSAELALGFKARKPGNHGIYADQWASWGHSPGTSDCSVEISGFDFPLFDFPDVIIPVPEPSSILMWMAGIPGLAFLFRRRIRKGEEELDSEIQQLAQAPLGDRQKARIERMKSKLYAKIGRP